MKFSLRCVILLVLALGNQAKAQEGTTRTYYIAADEVVWDYAPSGINQITGKPFGEEENFWVKSGPHSIGRVYKKAIYREYTDGTFATLKPRAPEWEHLGVMGPLIRAEVGDTIRVVFKNNAPFPATVHPHGVFYEKDSEGAPYQDGTSGKWKKDDGVLFGDTHTYTWPVSERAGPGPSDPNSVLWMYHSHANEVRDVNAGLMGPMIISARGTTRANGTPRDVDREFVVSFYEMDENESWYLEDNIRTYTSDPDGITIGRGAFGEINPYVNGVPDHGPNFIDSLNGFTYGHLPMLTMKVGERVRWYLMASTNFEVHAPHWHGNTVVAQGMRTDVLSLLTMGMIVADMVPDNPGIWLFHCHVSNHFKGGMIGRYEVEPE